MGLFGAVKKKEDEFPWTELAVSVATLGITLFLGSKEDRGTWKGVLDRISQALGS